MRFQLMAVIGDPTPVPEADIPLVVAALAVREAAHCPYSRFAVGAALRSADGRIFTGCNVENASFGLTNCAERVAIQSAVAAGVQSFTTLVVAAAGAVSPCGACRQVLAEFCPRLRTLLVDPADPHRVRETELDALLPGRFHLE